MTAAVSLLLLGLALLGAPLFAVIAASALIGFQRQEIDLQAVIIEIGRLAEMPVLIAIPLFTFAGYLLGEGRAAGRLVRLTDALLGWLPGGMAIVALCACALFTAFTGASGVTIVALGALLWPALRQAGYPNRFSLGLITSSGSLGLLFAPSIPLILYAVVAQQLQTGPSITIDQLFLAGILPGLLMLLVLSGWSVWTARKHIPDKPPHKLDGGEIRRALWDSKWDIPLPVFVLGGIYGGFIAVSEAAALAAIYVIVSEMLLYRDVPWRSLPRIAREAMTLVGAIMVILGVSLASTNYLIDAGVPTAIFERISAWVSDKWTFLILLNIFLLALGMMLDIFSAIVIMTPIILPIAVSYGIHPLHLGIVFLANMQIGYFTPPVGMNLFIASFRFNQPVMTLYRATLPFFFLLLAAVLAITYIPWLSMVLTGQ